MLSERTVEIGEVDTGRNGTVLTYPLHCLPWLHEWTSFDIDAFVSKTQDLKVKEVDLDIHYSIGCMYSHRSLWTNLQVTKESNFDELLIHQYC